MSVIYLRSLVNDGSLGPDEIKIAADAYEDALKLIGQAGADKDVRESLARHIISKVIGGNRDGKAIRNGAICTLSGVEDPERRTA